MEIKLGFTGDIAFSEHTKELYKNPKLIDKDIYSFLDSNDYNILNFESPVTESILTKKAALAHKSAPETLSFIKEKFNNPVLSLANNHMMDFGKKGLMDTIKEIKKLKLPYLGAGENEEKATDYVILGKDIKIGVIAAQYKDYVIATKDAPGPAHNKHFDIIKRKIKELKTKVDWVVMVYHGGEEFINTPMPYTRKLYKKMLSWGVDVVVAHHPHTVQGYEKIGNKTIFYSLGNFIFDTDFQRAQKGTDEGMLIKLVFKKDSYDFESYPVKRNREEGTINLALNNVHFKNIKRSYKKAWKKEARKLVQIKAIKKELKKQRNLYSISNLYIEKANCKNVLPFDDLIKKNYIEELENPPVFKSTNVFVRKFKRLFKKLKNANYKKYFYTKYAQIFKW